MSRKSSRPPTRISGGRLKVIKKKIDEIIDKLEKTSTSSSESQDILSKASHWKKVTSVEHWPVYRKHNEDWEHPMVIESLNRVKSTGNMIILEYETRFGSLE